MTDSIDQLFRRFSGAWIGQNIPEYRIENPVYSGFEMGDAVKLKGDEHAGQVGLVIVDRNNNYRDKNNYRDNNDVCVLLDVTNRLDLSYKKNIRLLMGEDPGAYKMGVCWESPENVELLLKRADITD